MTRRPFAFTWLKLLSGLSLMMLEGSALSAASEPAPQPPVIFWASDPVAPGETVLVSGSGLGNTPKVEVVRLSDGNTTQPVEREVSWNNATSPEVLQSSDPSLKFTVPGNLQRGVFAFRITGANGTTTGFVNRPVVHWLQGDIGPASSPGGWVRLFGRNLGWAEPVTVENFVPKLLLRGPRTILLNIESDPWSARATLPKDLPVGDYEVRLHNGAGGDPAWSEPLKLHVDLAAAWPTKVYNVHDFGADGSGTRDDTGVLQEALDKAGADGGGVVFLPRGRYQVTGSLTIPRFTVLRGERENAACLFWPSTPKPPEAMIRGTNHFAVEELTIYASNHEDILVGDTGNKPDSGHVRFWHVRVRADAYRGHLTTAEVDQRLTASLRRSTGGADSIRVGGPNVEIGECDIYGSGRALYLSRVRGGWIHDNHFYNGRWGWYCIAGSDGLIFEHNQLQGADLMSTGGGLNCLDGSRYSQNVYYSGNDLSHMNGWDRESMTSDAGGGPYMGHITTCNDVHLTLASVPKWNGDWTGAGIFVMNGHGAGQIRRVAQHDGANVTLDQPFAVPLDATSELTITQYQGHYLLIGNHFSDCGAMQFYGTGIENVVSSNTGARMSGFSAMGLWYAGFQPCMRCQFLGNHLSENYYHWSSADNSCIGLTGQSHDTYQGPMNLAGVVRGNELSDDAIIRVRGAVWDALVEKNHVSDADTGIFVSKTCERVLLKGNEFTRVTHEVMDEADERQAMLERLKKFMDRPEPIAVYDFESLANNKFEDLSGNHFTATIYGGVKQSPDGHKGHAVTFDGTGYLEINEPAVFNAPNITLDLWVKPAVLTGRRGLISKRHDGMGCPFVIAQAGNTITFEACTPDGRWSFNFNGPAVLGTDKWTRVTAVAKEGEGIKLYLDGKLAEERKNTSPRCSNDQPLIIGRESWGGNPPDGNTPGYFIGSIDDVRIWSRALSAEEIAKGNDSPR